MQPASHDRRLANLAIVAFAFVGTLVLLTIGALGPLDQALRQLRFQTTEHAPSGETLFVEIDTESLSHIGVWPWPREVHAAVLDKLMALGAAEVVFDIDFSAASNPASDLAFEAALERAGGYALLASFQQNKPDGTTALNTPLPRFAAHSEAVIVNVDGDGTQLLTSVPAGLANTSLRSLAVAFNPTVPLASPSIVIDYGIDLAAIDRISVSDLLNGTLDPARFADKQVIVGASAVELRDFFRVPRFGVIPGPLVQLAATETLKTGRPLSDAGLLPALVGALVAAALFVVGQSRANLAMQTALAIGGIVAFEAVAWLMLRNARLSVDTTPFHAFVVLTLLAGVLHERTLHWRQIFRQQSRLAYLANHDAVTDALSRQALLDQLQSQLLSFGTVSVLLVQLDRLDAATAALGHEIGDRVVQQVAGRLEHKLGHKAARIGSNVFAWSLPAALTTEQQKAFCLEIAISLERPYTIDGHSVVLDTQFGSTATYDHGVNAAELLRQADVALAHGQSSGAKTMTYLPEQSERIRHRRLQDIALRQALDRQEFFLLYQPQIDLATGQTIGVEALIRWQSESLGLISPADFIPLAEKTGLIVALGHWVLQEACKQATQQGWNGRLAVNVSSMQFLFGNVVASVQSALTLSGFPADRLDLELTESLFVDNDPAIMDALQTLRGMGIGIALDDFGTGYSSLSYLSRLPIDKLKIDQSFVRQLPDFHSEAIVETIVLMAKRLGKTVVAEGVETAQQRDYLASLGCEVGQGYLFGRPAALPSSTAKTSRAFAA